jgi:serine/threonine protein kinase
MVPISELMTLPKENPLQAYHSSGGMARRLRILGKVACILHELHSRSLVYADVNPNNIFISTALGEEVYLIDADNLAFRNAARRGIYFPRYGAPEVVRGETGNDTLCDRWSFAILAFQVLTTFHPFDGEFVEEGSWEDELDYEARVAMADRGEIEWGGDEGGENFFSDQKEAMLRATVPERVIKLFQRAFSSGRMSPEERPPLWEWASELMRIADQCVQCTNDDCRATYYRPKAGVCPFCGTSSPQVLIARAYHDHGLIHDAQGKGELDDVQASKLKPPGVWDKWWSMLFLGEALRLPVRVVRPMSSDCGSEVVFSVEYDKTSLSIREVGEIGAELEMNGRTRDLRSSQEIPLKSIRLAKVNCPHPGKRTTEVPRRILQFFLLTEGQTL